MKGTYNAHHGMTGLPRVLDVATQGIRGYATLEDMVATSSGVTYSHSSYEHSELNSTAYLCPLSALYYSALETRVRGPVLHNSRTYRIGAYTRTMVWVGACIAPFLGLGSKKSLVRKQFFIS